VLSKHLYYECVADADFDDFVGRLSRELVELPEVRVVQSGASWFTAPRPAALRPWRDRDGTILGAELLEGAEVSRQLPVTELEELAYPARLVLARREAFLIPIRPGWADAMMEVPRSQGDLFLDTDKLRLRTDNAYYCSPRFGAERLTNSPVLFYVSQQDQLIAGFARILACRIAEPEDLYAEFGSLGVYGLDNVRQHVGQVRTRYAGRAMALRFAWWVPFPTPISRRRMRQEFDLSHPQTVTSIPYEVYEQMLAAGGITW
jgi:hypothetical protein